MTRREHIAQLAAERGAIIYYEGFRYGMAADLVNNALILAPWGEDVPEEELYWVALHELGHLATTPLPGPLRTESVVEYEARAWAWALVTSIFPLDQAGQSAIAWGMADYITHRGLHETVATEAMRELVAALGPEPDWYMNVTTPEHYAKLTAWGMPSWAKLVALVEA